MTAPALEAPADLRPPAGHETAPVAPPAAGLGADPLDPGPRPGDQGWRYAILAQPQEGRVRTTDDGGFDFTPGADFPTLAVGELEQVSFTCEATDDAGARSIVIASLTVTGTADGPEICDVTYRQAQGTEAARRTTPEAGLGRSEGAPRAAAAEQDADDRPAPSPSGPVVDGAAGPLRPVVAGPAEPDRNKVAAAAGLDDEARVELPEAAPAGATTDPADDWPSWRSDAAIGVDAFEREPALAVEPAADDLAVPDSGEVETMGDPHGEAEGEPTAWEATTVTQSPPLRREEAWSADIGSDHQGPDAASGIPTGGPAPQDGGSVAITTGPAGGPRNERPTPDEIGEDRRPRDSYRGAVAAEAVATLLPDEPGAAAVGRLDVDPNSEAAPEEPASGPASTDGLAPSGRVPDRQAAILDGLFGAPDSGGPAAGEDRDASQDDPAMPAEPAAEVPPMAGPEPSAHGGDAWQASDALGEADEMPGATGAGTMDDEDLDLAAADDDTAESAELTDFSLSRDAVVEKSEAGTVVGQVLVAGAERGARFIFDLQNDAGGRFDINPRTGKVTVADGALLDHAAADHHDILVQVIAHSGVSCRKTLTIQVLPAGAAQAADPPQTAEGAAFEGRDATRHPALRAELGLAAELDSVSDAVRPDDGATGGSVMDTLRLDGVSGGPGLGSWTLELTAGEVVETNDDNLMLSPNSTGIVILEGCPVNVAFEGVERIEW